jgi:hypothetical protein
MAEPQFERRLIYLYVALVILEGPLRKWLLPGALGSLVAISRDPIAIVLLWQGYRRGLFRPVWLRNLWLLTLFAMGVGGLIPMFESFLPLEVWAFGLRTNLLHLPLILIIPGLLTARDLQQLLKRLLMLALPIALLMLWQYRSPIDAWINVGAQEASMQIRATSGVVRPPGPFSFITGAVEYFALINAVVLGGFLDRRLHPGWIAYGLLSSLLALSVSGSRLMAASLAVVWIGTFTATLLRRRRLPGSNILLSGLAIATALAMVVSISPLSATFQDGWETTSNRFNDANAEDGGVISRLQKSVAIPDQIIWQAPLLGFGLGLGTNFGSKLTTGKTGFALSESEIQRVLLESGLYIGLLFLVFRNALSIYVGSQAWRALGLAQHLPMSLFIVNLIGLSIGQIRLPTSMGFIVLSMAFSLTAARFSSRP